MGVFDFMKKKDDVVDLGEKYRKMQERKQAISESGGEDVVDLSSSSVKEEYPLIGGDVEDKRQKLAKRIVDMTNKIEELSNQIYHLQQRLEVVEKKTNVSRFE